MFKKIFVVAVLFTISACSSMSGQNGEIFSRQDNQLSEMVEVVNNHPDPVEQMTFMTVDVRESLAEDSTKSKEVKVQLLKNINKEAPEFPYDLKVLLSEAIIEAARTESEVITRAVLGDDINTVTYSLLRRNGDEQAFAAFKVYSNKANVHVIYALGPVVALN